MLSMASGQINEAPGLHRIRDRDDRRHRLVVDNHSFGGIARVFDTVRDHEGDGIADMAHHLTRQRMIRRHHQRRRHRDMCYRTG